MIKPISYIEKKIDATAMYRTVTLALSFLVLVSLVFSLFGIIPIGFITMLVSLVIALVTGLVVNYICARLWGVDANHESAVITALILFFLVFPAYTWFDHHIIALTVAIAMLSKYVIAIRRQHIFNAAAFGAVVVSLPGYAQLTWWIGLPELFVPLLIAGAVVVYKIRKWTLVLSFIAVAFIVFMFESWRFGADLSNDARVFFTSYPALFLAFFMLTEPFTMPPTKRLQVGYGALVGFLSSTVFFSPLFKMSPELALVLGNLVFYPASLRQKLKLTLLERTEVAHQTYEFVFAKPTGWSFTAGQYLEWMLPHSQPDNRGIRRYFTIASAPSEDTVRLGVKFAPTVSTYKDALLRMLPGDTITASQRAGDFMLPTDTTTKLGFIAGGIGITPFRSFVMEMLDTGVHRDTVLYSCTNTVAEIPYRDIFEHASMTFGLRNVFMIAKEEVGEPYERGYITEATIMKYSPDYRERTWYLSGPPGMVNAYGSLLKKMGVPGRQIVKDFFPGLA
jgi:glycine betaine catabolism B